MANLIAGMMSASDALDAYTTVLDVVQNNVANASTPGYANQTELLYSMPFDPATGANGGVRAGQVMSSRDEYLEANVQQQTTLLGQAQQDVNSLTQLQSQFDISGATGISSALNTLFQAFSAWSQTPTDTVARQNVIAQATNVAQAFNQTATGLSQAAANTQQQLQQTVKNINQLTAQLAGYNQQIRDGDCNDPGLDAQIHSGLEQLAQYASFSASKASDGTYTVLLNGQTPLVIENQAYNLQTVPANNDPASAYPLGPNHQEILDFEGKDITSTVTGGQLGSLLNTANVVLPGYLGDDSQPGELNTLTLQFASQVNTLLTGGVQADGTTAGAPLFTYGANLTDIAQTLQVDPAVTPGQLAAADPGPPAVSNGVPLALSQMAQPTDGSDEIGGVSYAEYYGNMASNIGSLLNNANSQLQAQQSGVAQAQNMRQQISGVSLDQEATILIQFQRAYEASSKLISVLDQLTEDTLNIFTTTS